MNYQELLHKNVKFKDILGEHSGVVNDIRNIKDDVYAYIVSFGQNIWFNVKDLDKTWWINER